MPIHMAPSYGLGEVGGLTVAYKHHITGTVGYDRLRMGGRIFKKLLHFYQCVPGWLGLLFSDRVECRKHCVVNATGVLEEGFNDFLNKLFARGVKEGGRVGIGGKLCCGAMLGFNV